MKTHSNPTPREHFSFVLNIENHQVFLFGGYYCTPLCDAEYNYNQLFRLGLNDLKWTIVELVGESPKGRCMHSMEIINGLLWVFGGKWMNNNKTEVFNDLWHVDVDITAPKLKWTKTQVSGKGPCARYAHASCSFRDKYAIHGGNDVNDETLDDLFILCTASLNWTRITLKLIGDKNVVMGRYHHTMVAADDALYILGGRNSNYTKDIELSFA